MNEIVADLRANAKHSRMCGWETHANLVERAAYEIEYLLAALQPFAEVPPDNPSTKHCVVLDAKEGAYHFLQADLDRAKALFNHYQKRSL